MIPLSRRTTSKGLGRTLLTYSRQSLPRPARFLSTTSLRRQSAALATATTHSDDHDIYVKPMQPHDAGDSASSSGLTENLSDFLQRQTPYTILPTPVPSDIQDTLNDLVFTSTPVQESLSVIDACLYNCFDVKRAQYVFNVLRQSPSGNAVLEARVYNLFLEAYLDMATAEVQQGDMGEPVKWLRESWSLFDSMENGQEKAIPNAATYAIMLKTWLRHRRDSIVDNVKNELSPQDILSRILNRSIPIISILADKSLSEEEAAEIVQILNKAAAELGRYDIINELGDVSELAAGPLADVPQVEPVRVKKKQQVPDKQLSGEDGKDTKDERAMNDPQEIPFNIANLRAHLERVAFAQRALPDDLTNRQKLLELSVYDIAQERLKYENEKLEDAIGNAPKLLSPHLQTWMYEWHEKLQRRLEAEIPEIVEEEKTRGPGARDTATRTRLGPFLSLLRPSKLSLITILELMRLQGTGGVSEGMKTARALLTVGKAVELEYKAQVLKKNNIAIETMPNRANDSSFFTKRAYEELVEWRKKASEYIAENQEWTSDWSHATRARVGSFLVECLMDVAMVKRTMIDKHTGEEISESQPAFFHMHEYVRGQKLGVLRLNPVVADRLSRDDLRVTLHPRHLPMLTKPRPWLGTEEGGYIYNKSSVMRLKDTQEQLTYLKHASKEGHMEHVFAGLDVLGSTPWKVNREVFDVVLEVWNSGKKFMKIPGAIYEEPEPVKPEDYDTNIKAKAEYMREYREWQLGKANNHSNRCGVNYKVEIARAFLADNMYFPHNIDFRGRAYPIPPHLNHIGDDLSRGLMLFAEVRPLGASGLRWLKIHLANLYGFDKGSFDERMKFVQDNLEEIFDSAERPLEGNRWWTKADDPWQCLATCKELTKALKSEDPEAYESCLPVHQDGTCNGLQHYAALGGDVNGAKQVNLDVTDRPADVYTHVADMVEEAIKKDCEKGEKYALMLRGKVARKVVKQTVMTTVYGVTYIGARAQIERQLKDRGDIPLNECWRASAYLAKKVIACIGNLFSGAKEIQNWLNLSARLIAKSIPQGRISDAISTGKPRNMKSRQASSPKKMTMNRLSKEQMASVVWTTPLGLPIVQPYRKTKRKQVMTSIQTVFISDPNAPSEVNAAKQATAFPPNFIHSLDATHMLLTALECSKNKITFASVHDSYWTHAGTITQMNEIIRDTFIALHESDVLQRLRQEFVDRYKDFYVPIVSLRTSNLSKVAIPSGVAVVDKSEEAQKELATLEGHEVTLEGFDADLTALVEDKSSETVSSETALDSDSSAGEVQADESSSPDDTVEARTELSKPQKRTKAQERAAEKERKEEEMRLALAEEAAERKAKTQAAVQSKFVRLVDLLPHLPQKGEFDVKTIKRSKYFFS